MRTITVATAIAVLGLGIHAPAHGVSVGYPPSTAPTSVVPEPSRAPADEVQRSGSVNVVLVLKEDFSRRGIAAVVRRTPGPDGRTLIALKRSTLTPETLSAAMAVVRASAAKYGEQPEQTINVFIRQADRLRPVTDEARSHLESILAELTSARPQTVAGVGRVPAVTTVVTY